MYKDAGGLSLPCRDPALMREVTSFVSAASFWGVGRDVMELDDIVLKSTQVPIVKDDKGVCRLQTSLKVDRFAYDDAAASPWCSLSPARARKSYGQRRDR